MDASITLKRRIATYRDPEARALIHFLIQSEEWSVASRLDLTPEQARQNVAERAIDFLTGIQDKLPGS